jgi:O-antigen/teichoic acid export membrane protein
MPLTEQSRRLRRDLSWNLVPVALLGVVGLGLTFAIAGWWGPTAYAVFNLVTTAYFAFAIVGVCGLQFSTLRAVAEQPDDRDRVAAIVVGALLPTLVLSAIATAGFLAARPLIVLWLGIPDVGEGMLWAAPGLFCFSLNKLLFGVVNGLRRMRVYAIYSSLRYLLIAAGVIIARLADVDAAHLAGIWTFTEVILLLVMLGELFATVSLSRARGVGGWIRNHLAYGVRGVVATLAYELNTKLDVWLLGVYVADTSAVGIYALAAALHEGVMQLACVVQNNLDPVIARLYAERDLPELHAMVGRTRRWFVPAIIAICVTATGVYPLVIPPLIGNPAFMSGALPFAIFMTGISIASLYLPFAHLLLMAKRPGWHTVLLVAAIAVNIVASVVLIPRLGLSGAAISMAATVVFSAVLLRALARWRLRVLL